MRAWRGVREVIWRTGRKFHLTSNVEAQFYYKCNNASIKSDSLIDNCCYASIPVVVVYPELKRKQYLINNIIHIFHNSISCCNFIPWLTITIPISPLLHVPMISPASTSICANILPCFCFYLYPTSTCIHVLCTHVLSGSCFYMYPRRALFMHIHISPMCPVPTCKALFPVPVSHVSTLYPIPVSTSTHTDPCSGCYMYPHPTLFLLLHLPMPFPVLASTYTHAVPCSCFYTYILHAVPYSCFYTYTSYASASAAASVAVRAACSSPASSETSSVRFGSASPFSSAFRLAMGPYAVPSCPWDGWRIGNLSASGSRRASCASQSHLGHLACRARVAGSHIDPPIRCLFFVDLRNKIHYA